MITVGWVATAEAVQECERPTAAAGPVQHTADGERRRRQGPTGRAAVLPPAKHTAHA